MTRAIKLNHSSPLERPGHRAPVFAKHPPPDLSLAHGNSEFFDRDPK